MTGELTTEARILEVASRLFYERGYEATTMRDLATGVGIEAASLYNHFSGKQAILVRICLDGMQEFYEGAFARIEGVDDARERLRALIVWLAVSETRYPYAGRIADEQMNALSPRSRHRLIMLRDAFEALIDDVLGEGQTQGIWQISHPRVISARNHQHVQDRQLVRQQRPLHLRADRGYLCDIHPAGVDFDYDEPMLVRFTEALVPAAAPCLSFRFAASAAPRPR